MALASLSLSEVSASISEARLYAKTTSPAGVSGLSRSRSSRPLSCASDLAPLLLDPDRDSAPSTGMDRWLCVPLGRRRNTFRSLFSFRSGDAGRLFEGDGCLKV